MMDAGYVADLDAAVAFHQHRLIMITAEMFVCLRVLVEHPGDSWVLAFPRPLHGKQWSLRAHVEHVRQPRP